MVKHSVMKAEIQSKKIELIQWLSTLEDTAIIDKLIKLRRSEDSDFWDSITDSEKQSIAKGISDADSNRLQDHSSIKMLYEKWL